jgi:hypothetical protein
MSQHTASRGELHDPTNAHVINAGSRPLGAVHLQGHYSAYSDMLVVLILQELRSRV